MNPITAALNHVLAQNAWAQAKLAPFAGKKFQLTLPPALLRFSIDAAGTVAQTNETTPDATLSATPSGFLRFLTVMPRDADLIQIEGDIELGKALREVLTQITWEVEEDLSRLVGDVLAHRVAGLAKGWLHWREQSLNSFALSASEYLTEEQTLLAKPRHLAQFTQEVAAVESAVNNLEERIQKLFSHG